MTCYCRFSQERIRARQERNIGGVKDGLVEGGEALSKGFVRGMTGIVTKPLEGAKSRGAFGAHPGSLCALRAACFLPLAMVGRWVLGTMPMSNTRSDVMQGS